MTLQTRVLTLVLMLWPAAALAQADPAPQQSLPTDQAIPGLMFFTLIAGIVVAGAALAVFLRRRSNREAMGLEKRDRRTDQM